MSKRIVLLNNHSHAWVQTVQRLSPLIERSPSNDHGEGDVALTQLKVSKFRTQFYFKVNKSVIAAEPSFKEVFDVKFKLLRIHYFLRKSLSHITKSDCSRDCCLANVSAITKMRCCVVKICERMILQQHSMSTKE